MTGSKDRPPWMRKWTVVHKRENYLGQLRDCQFLKKASAPWCQARCQHLSSWTFLLSNKKPLGCRETSGNKHQMTQCHIAEELISHPQGFENQNLAIFQHRLWKQSGCGPMALLCHSCEPSAVRGTANILNLWIIMCCTTKDSKPKIRDASQGITVYKSNFKNQLWYIYLRTLSNMWYTPLGITLGSSLNVSGIHP
jgi:hypothetical protein